MRLSHSKATKFRECGAKYDFYYNKRWRTSSLGSPLWFGTALDDAIGRLLLEKKTKISIEESELLSKYTPESLFDKMMEYTTFNKEKVSLKCSDKITFSKKDFQPHIFTDDDYEQLSKVCDIEGLEGKELEKYLIDTNNYYHSIIKTGETLEAEALEEYCLLNWTSLKRKGYLIIEQYRKQIMPQIKEVLDIQRKVNLPNDDGDSIIGFIDFSCIFNEEPEIEYDVDNKSSSKPYKQKDLEESDQLHTYAEFTGRSYIAYVVYEKDIRKREKPDSPRVRINILKGEVNESHTDSIFETYEQVTRDIKAEKFSPNFESGCFSFGKKCEYYSICHHDKWDERLVKLGERK